MKLTRVSITILFLIILTVLYFVFKTTEGFKASGPACGLGFEGCSQGEKCMNGFCDSVQKPCLPKNELPVYS